MTAPILDFEAYRGRLAEEHAARSGPARYSGAELSPDGDRVLLTVGTGELTWASAIALGQRLLALGEIVRDGGGR